MFNGADHFADAWLYLGAPSRAVEDAVVANAGLDVMEVFIVRNIGAQVMGSSGLTQPADVVLLAFNCHDGCLANGGAVDSFVPMHHVPVG